MIAWGPDGRTEALEAIGSLLQAEVWQESRWAEPMRVELLAALKHAEPNIRYLGWSAIRQTLPDDQARARVLGEALAHEDDIDLLTVILQALGGLPSAIADVVLTELAESRAGPSAVAELVEDRADGRHELRRVWATQHLRCSFLGDAPHSTATTEAWFALPSDNPESFAAAVSVLRSSLSYESLASVRRRAFDLAQMASRTLANELHSRPNDAAVVRSADSLIQELYFASGAFEGNASTARPSLEQRAAWFRDGMSTLENLTSVNHPHSCYQLLEIFEYLIDESPTRVFKAIAATVGTVGLFQYESMGVSVVVRIVERYIAEYRQLFVDDSTLLTQLRMTLEIFARVGWPAALHLSYELGEIFR